MLEIDSAQVVVQKSVLNREGLSVNYDPTKIRKVVSWACEGLDVNPIVLEGSLKKAIKSGTTTRDIQATLINQAVKLTSLEEPDWRYVAGRLHIWNIRQDVLVERGYLYENFAEIVRSSVIEGKYDPLLLSYTEEELTEAGRWMQPDNDKDYDYAGAVLWSSRYLLKDELPQEALMCCALLLAVKEKEENRITWAKLFYDAISSRKISLATPILASLRVPDSSLGSCFILDVEDNLESIFHEITNAARISKKGGGVGIRLSKIRATGSKVMGKKNASGGVLPWMKLFNDTATAVNQGKLQICPLY